MALAKVFQSGNSQAVRPPKDFRVAGHELEIFRRGDEIILRETRPGLFRVGDILAALPEDFLAERYNPPLQERQELS